MVDFPKLQLLMKSQLEEDRTIRSVDVVGDTIETAISEAAVMLNLPVRQIEYEVVQHGSAGFLGAGKKEWKIKAYKKVVTKKLEAVLAEEQAHIEELKPVVVNKNGEVFVLLSDDGAVLKVVPPMGTGRAATVDDAMRALKARNVIDIDNALVKSTVKEALSTYLQVGSYSRKYTNDSTLNVNITDANMKAYITVTQPGPGGADLTYETIIKMLKENKVVFGIKEDALKNFVDHPVYKTSFLVAEGLEPVNGKNAYVQYFFRTEQGKAQIKEKSDGSVDFKESSAVQNVVQDQPLGKKIPAEEGVNGRDVTGVYSYASQGKDIDVPLGNNVRLADDRVTILSNIAGQVSLVEGAISVEAVYTVNGNVNLKTGNIIFLGSVVITGDVEDGFSVKAQGNIEIKGIVENAELEAEGDIVVLKGISGKTTGTVRAGQSVYARFIENAIIEAGNMVIASEGIINSQVDAYKRIVCHGKRARIVGGRYRASEEINAKTIGSAGGGTETICEVGVDPKAKKQYEDLFDKKRKIEAKLEETKLNFQTLDNLQKQRKALPPEKEAQMQEIMELHKTLISELHEVTEEISTLEEAMSNAKTRGRISAGVKIYPGVKLAISNIQPETVKVEHSAITFVAEGGLIMPVKYEEPDEEAKRPPPGYT